MIKSERQHPPGMKVPHPDRPPTRFDLMLYRFGQWLKKLNGGGPRSD